VTKDGECIPIDLKAEVNQMWAEDGGDTITFFDVKFTATNIPNRIRMARVINDWSRIKLGSLKWTNSNTNKNIKLSPLPEYQNHQIFDSDGVVTRGNTWRYMFKDGQSKQLSDMVIQQKKIDFTLRLTFPGIPTSEKDQNFELTVTDPKLCDGGYINDMTITYEPTQKKPDECSVVDESFLLSKYIKPTNEQSQANLGVQATDGVIGCNPYIILGLDAPRSQLIQPQNEIKELIALNRNLQPCGCEESSYWKIVLD
jgi:hypothetical protein